LTPFQNSKQHTAAAPYPQENPPRGAQEAASEAAFPSPEALQEKADMSLQGSLAPQEGQRISTDLSEEKNSCSKTCPHFLHWNS